MRHHQAKSTFQKSPDEQADHDDQMNCYADTPKMDLAKLQQQGSSEIPVPDAIKREILSVGTTPSGMRITATAIAPTSGLHKRNPALCKKQQ